MDNESKRDAIRDQLGKRYSLRASDESSIDRNGVTAPPREPCRTSPFGSEGGEGDSESVGNPERVAHQAPACGPCAPSDTAIAVAFSSSPAAAAPLPEPESGTAFRARVAQGYAAAAEMTAEMKREPYPAPEPPAAPLPEPEPLQVMDKESASSGPQGPEEAHERAAVEPARPHHLAWNGTEWVDERCGCRYHPDDDSGSHGGAPHVHRCERHEAATKGGTTEPCEDCDGEGGRWDPEFLMADAEASQGLLAEMDAVRDVLGTAGETETNVQAAERVCRERDEARAELRRWQDDYRMVVHDRDEKARLLAAPSAPLGGPASRVVEPTSFPSGVPDGFEVEPRYLNDPNLPGVDHWVLKLGEGDRLTGHEYATEREAQEAAWRLVWWCARAIENERLAAASPPHGEPDAWKAKAAAWLRESDEAGDTAHTAFVCDTVEHDAAWERVDDVLAALADKLAPRPPHGERPEPRKACNHWPGQPECYVCGMGRERGDHERVEAVGQGDQQEPSGEQQGVQGDSRVAGPDREPDAAGHDAGLDGARRDAVPRAAASDGDAVAVRVDGASSDLLRRGAGSTAQVAAYVSASAHGLAAAVWTGCFWPPQRELEAMLHRILTARTHGAREST